MDHGPFSIAHKYRSAEARARHQSDLVTRSVEMSQVWLPLDEFTTQHSHGLQSY